MAGPPKTTNPPPPAETAPRPRPDDTISRPCPDDIARHTDHYFLRSKEIVGRFGDKSVTYAVFMRRPVVFAPRLAVEWIQSAASARGIRIDVRLNYKEGDWVGAGEPLMYVAGSFFHLVDLETIYLQKLGPTCVAAYNAFTMCVDLPKVRFMAMDARHCAGIDMADMMAYAASVGTAAAKAQNGAVGFVGNANDATAHYFGRERGMGTMPHALVGYAGSTLRAAEMYAETYPGEDMTVLVDYYGKEVSDALDVCRRFPDMAAAGRLAFRLDTHGGRFIEGLGPQESYAVLERHAPLAIRRYRSDVELRYLTGTGVSAAAIFHLRESLDRAGFPKTRIVASSGFNWQKCKVMADVGAPVDLIGTGSYLPENWSETFATADIVEYDGVPTVKVGREFLLKSP